MKENTNNEQVRQYPCPTCDGQIPNNQTPGAYPGALSRNGHVEICSDCGTREAISAFTEAHKKNEIFVTDDGTWGDAADLKIFDITDWTDEQFDEFDNASDSDKMKLAREFSWKKCPQCDYPTHPDALAQWGKCHDCENQSCPDCGEIECEHEF